MTNAPFAPAPQSPYAPPANRNGIATASLVLGIISIFINPLLLTSLAGIITGIVGAVRSPIGRTKAIVGIVLSVVGGVIGLIITIVIFSAIGAASNAVASSAAEASQVATAGPQTGASTVPSAAATKAAAGAPAGYTNIGDNVFFKYGKITKNEFETIQAYTVIAKDGCPSSFYIEANELDKSGAIVGYTNDTVGSIPAGGKYKGKFDITDDGVDSLKVTQETCD